jgi:hypothetical protein
MPMPHNTKLATTDANTSDADTTMMIWCIPVSLWSTTAMVSDQTLIVRIDFCYSLN